ncbi:polysaccharide biosynthesis protein [Paraclostridium bifermentans]
MKNITNTPSNLAVLSRYIITPDILNQEAGSGGEIGIRHGEKMHETLLTKEEMSKAIDMGNFYRVPMDKRDLNYDKYFIEGDSKLYNVQEFNSSNTKRLNVDEVIEKLLELDYIKEELST